MITGVQIRAARAMLGWTAKELAANAELSWATIQRMESGSGPISGLGRNIHKVQEALERGGVVLLPKDERGGLGVRFKS